MNVDGYLLIKVFEEKELPVLRRKMLLTCKFFPEFTNSSVDKFVMGGFGALGNPASFHNYFVRWHRLRLYKQVEKLFPKDKKVQALFDRMMIRPAFECPSRESWHRDVAPNTLDGDIVLGGWTNFDSLPQYFSCVPGTHDPTGNTGFVSIKNQNFKGQKIKIDPGWAILFHQSIIHEVLPTKLTYTSYRIFHGFRITQPGVKPLFDYSDTIANQGIPQLPSGQNPPMYAKLHWVHHVQKLVQWSVNLLPQCKERKTRQKDKTSYLVPHRFMKSLRDYNLPMFSPYHQSEVDIFL